VETYKENLKKIIQHPATVAQNPRILILTPPPVNEYQLEEFDIAKDTPHPSRTVKQTKLYSEAAREVAASLGIAVVDLWTAFMTAAGWKDGEPLIGSRDAPNNEKLQSFFTDGLHFTGDGYRLMYEEVMKTIIAKWPDQAPETLEMVFPGWMEAPK
jgi:lysophospholipase L1-like esterase